MPACSACPLLFRLQVAHFGVSQVIGFTGDSLCPGCADEWPSTSMVDWYTGRGNARYWALMMLLQELPTGTKRAPTTTVEASPEGSFAAQAFVTAAGERKLLLVSKSAAPPTVTVPEAGGGSISFIDGTTGDTFSCVPTAVLPCYVLRKPLAGSDGSSASFVLGSWGTAVVTLPAA
jgi:hypothetical protein